MQFIFAASAETPVFYARFPRAPPCFARAVRAKLLRRAGAKKAELSGSALCENLAWLLRPFSAESEKQGARAEEHGDRRGFGNLPERHRKGFVVPQNSAIAFRRLTAAKSALASSRLKPSGRDPA